MFLLSLFLLTIPWLIFVGLVLLISNSKNSTKKNQNNGLCTLPGCVRCNKNKQKFALGMKRFNNLYKDIVFYDRIKRGLNLSAEPTEELFLKIEFQESRPIWCTEHLNISVKNDLEKLCSNTNIITEECEKALKFVHLWQKNEEDSSFWYVFPLMNQGIWQNEQCSVCKNLVRIFHSMNNLMTNSLLGNVFISMLPRNSEISKHRGLTNARLRVHFGVEIPKEQESCFMLVGEKKLYWTKGDFFVFDDSYPHSVNSKNCKEDRIALVFDIWHPELLSEERHCLMNTFSSV